MKSELTPSRPGHRRWMIVDDDAGMREFMASLVELSGEVEAVSHASANEALSVFAAAPEQYHFIITDYDMPGMNGVEFCRRVLALAPGMKVLLVTGQPAMSESEARRLGFCGLLAKPFPPTALWQVLETVAV